jgi:hypothetical protein
VSIPTSPRSGSKNFSTNTTFRITSRNYSWSPA